MHSAFRTRNWLEHRAEVAKLKYKVLIMADIESHFFCGEIGQSFKLPLGPCPLRTTHPLVPLCGLPLVWEIPEIECFAWFFSKSRIPSKSKKNLKIVFFDVGASFEDFKSLFNLTFKLWFEFLPWLFESLICFTLSFYGGRRLISWTC